MTFATSDMWVKEAALGTNLELTAPGAEPTVMLKIPSEESEWVKAIDDYRVFNGYSTHIGGPLVSAAVAVVRVEVVYRSRRLRQLDTAELADAASALGNQSRQIAEQSLSKFLDHIRAHGQFWLGMSMQRPAIIDGPTVWELETGHEPVRLPSGATLGTLFVDRHKAAADVELLAKAAADTVNDCAPPLAEVLLADAKQLVVLDSPAVLRHAVLLAAVSAELKIKSSLTALASDEQRGLVTLLFDKPRDYSVAAVALLDEPLKLVSGQSLRDADAVLFRSAEQLFRVRNKIVHSGVAFTKQELIAAVNSAQRIGRYLDGLLGTRVVSTHR